jgi:hypothetical protein
VEVQGAEVTTRGMFYNTCMRGWYASINVNHSNAIPKYLSMCIKAGECKYCNWTIYYGIPIPTYGYMQM